MAIRIIHIGAGARGRHWLRIVEDYPQASCVAVVDTDLRALDEARKLARGPVQFHIDLRKALQEVPADAALITSPSFLHAEHALQALDANLTVFTEKPFTTELRDAYHVISKARAAGKHVIVGENYRFFPAERTVRRWIAENRLGNISNVTCIDRRNQPSADQGPWVASMTFPQLEEIAVHHFDSFRYLLNRNAVSVTARVFNPPGSDYTGASATEALINMEGNLPIVYLGTLTSHRYEYSLWIEGENGSLWTDRKRVWWRKKGARFFFPVKLVSVPKGDEQPYPRGGTTSLLNQVRDAILHNKEGETSGADNFWTLAMVSAAKRSAQEAREISISEVTNSLLAESGDRSSEGHDASRLRSGARRKNN